MMIQFESMTADCVFSEYMPQPFSLKKLKDAWSRWQNGLEGKGWNMLYIENHDHPRIISRYGSEAYRAESGKALAAAYLFQKGTPFVYQGQEIGMTNWRPADPDMYEDVNTRWQYAHVNTDWPDDARLKLLWEASRDSARTPMQWSGGRNAGFTTAEKPWFFLNDNYRQVNVADQEADPDSLLNFYRKAIALRKSLRCVRCGSYAEHAADSDTLYMYSRECEGQRLLAVCSFSDRPQPFAAPAGFDLKRARLALASCDEPADGQLGPYESRVYLWE